MLDGNKLILIGFTSIFLKQLLRIHVEFKEFPTKHVFVRCFRLLNWGLITWLLKYHLLISLSQSLNLISKLICNLVNPCLNTLNICLYGVLEFHPLHLQQNQVIIFYQFLLQISFHGKNGILLLIELKLKHLNQPGLVCNLEFLLDFPNFLRENLIVLFLLKVELLDVLQYLEDVLDFSL